MATYGMLIDYEYCTNCGSCIIACKEEHGYGVEKTGIKILGDGPWKVDAERWNWNWYPVLTDLCDLCEERTGKGKEPFCVHHCLSNILVYGTVEELALKLVDKPKQALVVPEYKPMDAKGPFISKGYKKHCAAHIEVMGTGKATYAVHRPDSKEGDFGTDDTGI